MKHNLVLPLVLLLPILMSCKTPKAEGATEQKQGDPSQPNPPAQPSPRVPPIAPVGVHEVTYEGNAYRVITVDTAQTQIKLTSHFSTKGAVHSFLTLKSKLAREGKTLFFAMNAGMFHPDFAPVGLYIEDSKAYVPLNLSDAAGNFFLKPNGYFALTRSGPLVGISESWDPANGATLATQSGPMLVIDGMIHPQLTSTSPSFNIRNGVGVTGGRFVHFVISLSQVRLYDFAQFFKTGLGCLNALYLDGHISQAYVRGIQETQPVARNFGTLIYTE